MADTYYSVPASPAYDLSKIRRIQNSDPVNAEQIINPVVEALIGNIAAIGEELFDPSAESAANAALEAANAAASTASAAASAASAAQETAERALELAGVAGGEAVGAHNTAEDAHPALHIAISGLESRLTTLELKHFYDVTGNSFEVSFVDLTGLEVSGVWNKELARIEF